MGWRQRLTIVNIAAVAIALALWTACTSEEPTTAPSRPATPMSLVVPDVEEADLQAGYRVLKDAGFDVIWDQVFWKSPSFLRTITRYARGVGPKPPYSWIADIRPRPGTEVEQGAEVSIMKVRCPKGYRRGSCNARPDARPIPHDKARRVTADCSKGSVRPPRMTLACADNGFRARRLVWSKWRQRSAVGRGVFLLNDCDPGCVVGRFHRRSGRIVLGESRICEKLDAYVFMSGRVIFDRPFEGRISRRIYPGCPFR